MQVQELKQLYFNFFIDKGHALIPSASLIPINDPTALFTSAGMQPLVPNLLGEPHQSGKRLVDVQKCLRTSDIDSVGDDSHLTFFEMLGNWSLGDYFKEDSIKWSYEFLTAKNYLNIDPSKLFITCFGGDKNDGIPKDEESAELWQKEGITNDHIFFLGKTDNFWGPVGDTGPCGPDTEIFYETDKEKCSDNCQPGCSCGKYLEIWNNVFMEYNRTLDGKFESLKQKNVDTGMGVERTVAVLNGQSSVYDIDHLAELLTNIKNLSRNPNKNSLRIIADHLRAATFLLADDANIEPSNKDQGYILRRLIRRAVRHARTIDFDLNKLTEISRLIIRQYHRDHGELNRNSERIFTELDKEKNKFLKTLTVGLKEFEKIKNNLPENLGASAFDLFQSYGFPIEMFFEELKTLGIKYDEETVRDQFNQALTEHQGKSRTASAGKFAGGLADHSEQTTKYHTANHMMLEALRRVLGDHVQQKGSNITAERLRFDFSHPDKLTDEQIRQVEDIVNTEIARNLEVHFEEMSVDEAKKAGATGVFEHKYGNKIKVYFIGDFSKEICGGPHVSNTKDMGKLKIINEKSSSSGIRRIKAILE